MTKRLLGLLICLIISKFNLYQDILLGDYVPGNGIVLTSTDNNYKVGQWYTDGVLSGDIQTPTDPEFNQILPDEELIIMLEPVEYE